MNRVTLSVALALGSTFAAAALPLRANTLVSNGVCYETQYDCREHLPELETWYSRFSGAEVHFRLACTIEQQPRTSQCWGRDVILRTYVDVTE